MFKIHNQSIEKLGYFNKKSAILLFVILLLCLTGLALTTYTQLLETVSDSLQGINYILAHKSSSIQRGDIVAIRGHTIKYIGEKRLAKRVLGLPGDRIVHNTEGIIIIPHPSNTLPLLTQTSNGNPLTPLVPTIIPEDYLFVAGDNPQSFDSRYEEFGLVHKEKIWGKAVITW